MFRQIQLPANTTLLRRRTSAELATLLELAWDDIYRAPVPGPPPMPPQIQGAPNLRSNIPPLPNYWLDLAAARTALLGGPGINVLGLRQNPNSIAVRPRWHHLIYAYAIESTGIYQVFRKVVDAFTNGESLGPPIVGSENWLRTTEEMFFRAPPPFHSYSTFSDIRSDIEGTRRNAYHRMFGMELSLPGDQDKAPYAYRQAKTANTSFLTTFEEFLREVWKGILYLPTTSGPNPVDNSKIANLAHKLHDMFRARRLGGNLAREEFYFVSMMSWFHLTVDSNTDIVLSLRADAPSPEERLLKIASRVEVPAHTLSKSFFDIADMISAVFIGIETGLFNTAAAAPLLYNPALTAGFPGPFMPLSDTMREIITHWSIMTGRDLRAPKVMQTGSPLVARLNSPQSEAQVVESNGHLQTSEVF